MTDENLSALPASEAAVEAAMADMAVWQNRTARRRVSGAGFDAIVV